MESLLSHIQMLTEAAADSPLTLFGVLFGLSVLNVFIPPIPVETLTFASGFVKDASYNTPLLAWVSVSFGMAVGSTLLYLLIRAKSHYLFTTGLVQREVTSGRFDRADRWFKRYGLLALFLAKLVPGMGLITLLCAAMFRVRLLSVLVVVYASNTIYYGAVALLGEAASDLGVVSGILKANPLSYAIVLGAASVAALLYIVMHRRRRRRS